MRKSKSSVLASGGWLLLNLLCWVLGVRGGGVGRVGTFIHHPDQSTLVCDKEGVRAISAPSEGGTGQ